MKTYLSQFLAIVAGSSIAAGIYRLLSATFLKLLRIGSLAKCRALFPQAHNLSIDVRADVKYPERIQMGDHVIIGAYCQIGALAPIFIGDYVRISRGVTIETATLNLDHQLPYPHVARPIHIGRGVWLGTQSIVLGGVTIGDGAVIGAGTVVARDVPAGAIIVGSTSRQLHRQGVKSYGSA